MSKTKLSARDILNRLAGIESKITEKFEENTEEQKENEATEEVKQDFAEVTLMDGETVLSYDGELAAGTAIFIVGEEGEQMPAPEGTHELGGDFAGVSIIVDAEGVITEVVDERETAEVENSEEAMSEEKVNSIVAEAVAKALEPVNELVSKFEKLSTENAQFKKDIDKLKEAPSEPAKERKFNRDNDLTPRQRIILSRNK